MLEPLSGYLSLACALSEDDGLNGEAFNFGPPAHQDHSVEELVNEIITHWPGSKWVHKSEGNEARHEAGLLKLNCDKALHSLGWKATLSFKETAKYTAEWYRTYYEKGAEAALDITKNQINKYMDLAKERDSYKLA